jgi:hypothetical protein
MQDMHQRNMEDAHNNRRKLDLPPSPPAASLCSTAHDITPRQATQHLWAGSIMGESEAALHAYAYASCGDERARPAPTVASDAIAPHTTPDAFAPETHNRSNHTYGYEQHAPNRVQSGATGGSAAEDHKRALVHTLKNDIRTLKNDMSSRMSMLLERLDELLSA